MQKAKVRKDVLKMQKAKVRKDALEAGFADGRFRTRTVEDKRYKKPKHKNKADE